MPIPIQCTINKYHATRHGSHVFFDRAVQCFIVKTSPIVFFVDRLSLSLKLLISHSRHRQAAAVAHTII